MAREIRTNEEIKRLIKESQEGNKESLDSLFEIFKPLRKAQYYKLSNKGVDNSDIAQEIDTSFCDAVMSYPGEPYSKAKAYLVSRTKSGVWNYYYDQMGQFDKKRKDILMDNSQLEAALSSGMTIDSPVSPEDDIVQSMDIKIAIGKLSEYHQKLIKLYFFEGLTYEQISKICGVHRTSISRQINVALKELKKYLE